MLKVIVAAVGRLKESHWIAAQDDYATRLRVYCALTITEARHDEGLGSAIPSAARLYVLDERGPSMTSGEFASGVLGAAEMHGAGAPLAFAIGGPDGHGNAIRERAYATIGFGRFTIAHRLMRIVLLEQIYRGFRILRGEPYHRD
jgi:23S rRNA (pseudouridine1915-N3)-methyltransferase